MITLKEHIDLFESVKDTADLAKSLSVLKATQKLDIFRNFEKTYPLKGNLDVSDYVNDNFNFYDNVFELTLGQFIMIEQILTGKFKFKKESDMDLEIGSYLFRPKGETKFDNTDKALELQNKKNILKLPVEDFYSALNKYLRNRDLIVFKRFAGVFYEMPSKDESSDNGVDTSEEVEASFNQQWYWYTIVRSLAQEDIRRYDEIYMLKMKTVLPEMSYISQKNKIESAQQRASAAMNRL
jgi:hypothetical protein